MPESKQIEQLTQIIDRLPLGRMRSEYIKQRDQVIENIKRQEEESEIIFILVDVAKQMNTECFMCKEIIARFDANQSLSEAEKYHICADVPSTVRVKGFRGRVMVSIDLFVNRLL
jgi:hypothetical protein